MEREHVSREGKVNVERARQREWGMSDERETSWERESSPERNNSSEREHVSGNGGRQPEGRSQWRGRSQCVQREWGRQPEGRSQRGGRSQRRGGTSAGMGGRQQEREHVHVAVSRQEESISERGEKKLSRREGGSTKSTCHHRSHHARQLETSSHCCTAEGILHSRHVDGNPANTFNSHYRQRSTPRSPLATFRAATRADSHKRPSQHASSALITLTTFR